MKENLDECRDMLDGNLNRLMVCDDIDELKHQFSFAIRRVVRIYELRVNIVRQRNVDEFVGTHIRVYREAMSLSQRDLANALGIGQTTVSSWERGINEPDIASLKTLAAFFGVNVDDMLCAEFVPVGCRCD